MRSTQGLAAARRPWWRHVRRSGPELLGGGDVRLGLDVVFARGPVRSHIEAFPGAIVEIGDRVHVAHGVAISCASKITIGEDTRLGPFVSLLDSDFHVAGDGTSRPLPGPIVIGRNVRLGGRVVVLRNAEIGDDVVVEPGSVVRGVISPGSRVRGIPARPLRPSLADADVEGWVPG